MIIALLLAILWQSLGCSSIAYYSHVAKGHLQVMGQREPIVDLLENKELNAELRLQLESVQSIRDFASDVLLLPRNKSYRSYADLQRPYVVWNVIAAPEFELQTQKWCFLVAGCVSYRGFFTQQKAERFASKLREADLDVSVYGVSAYSTLGWFADPVLNTMLSKSRVQIASIIFHELAHQLLYLKDDTLFNEGFATAVEQLGVERWLDLYGSRTEKQEYSTLNERRRWFVQYVELAKKRLNKVYEQAIPEPQKRVAKQKTINAIREEYKWLVQEKPEFAVYRNWFAKDLNNAKLMSVSNYYNAVPYFRDLFEKSNNDFAHFYEAVKALSDLEESRRNAAIFAFDS